MDPRIANIFKRSNYDEPIASELSAVDYRYEVLLEIRESENSVILKYCNENFTHNVHVQEFIERMTVALEKNNYMHESIDNDDSDDLVEISLDEHDACYSCGHDANIYEDKFAIVSYFKHEIVDIASILDSSFDEKHDCNDFTINSLDVNCANNMQNPKLGDASFAMYVTYCNDHDWGDSSYDLENLFKPHDEYEIDNSV